MTPKDCPSCGSRRLGCCGSVFRCFGCGICWTMVVDKDLRIRFGGDSENRRSWLKMTRGPGSTRYIADLMGIPEDMVRFPDWREINLANGRRS